MGIRARAPELSYAFRYPVKNDGVTPNFDNKSIEDKTDVITRLQKSLSTSEQLYLLEKAKNTDNELSLLQSK